MAGDELRCAHSDCHSRPTYHLCPEHRGAADQDLVYGSTMAECPECESKPGSGFLVCCTCRAIQLTELAAWMRANGATRARVGELELELSPGPVNSTAPSPRREPLSEEELAKQARERKRAKYRAELGHPIDDKLLDGLP